MAKIIYTHTDEAPMLATASLLPIIEGFTKQAGIDVELRDISLAGRIIAAFSDLLPAEQRCSDALAELGELATKPEANIIKLPNISASIPQLKAAIAELQELGYDLPDYPEEPATEAERDWRRRYDSVKGSAVNPVLREGNSDRRAPQAVKNFAKNNPHSMKPWAADSKTRVATMGGKDFRANEVSTVVPESGTAQIVHVAPDGTETVLRAELPVSVGEVLDATKLDVAVLGDFLTEQVAAAKRDDVLFSLHLKATMMKVSDPIIFGHAVRAFFPETFAQYGQVLDDAGLSANDGLGSIFAGLDALEGGAQIRESFAREMADGPRLSMVNSDRGITNLHVPSDVIVDASMPAMIRNGGQLWGPDGEADDTVAVIPDSSYAGIYQAVIEDCQARGAFDPTTMGTVPNVGLMAQKAEEYGSHDKTFEIEADGTVEVRLRGQVLLSVPVSAGDIFRSCQTKDAPIRDWVSLAVRRSRISGMPAIFWLDPTREHDQQIRAKVETYLADEDTSGLDIKILAPVDAMRETLQRVRAGQDTISVTGNVLRDYLTDLFPIMELGTSAKMLSVVPLMAGGGLFETGAGGSAPRHVEQLVKENHLRWDSLGEFLALAESLRHLARFADNPRAGVVADCLDRATETLLNEGRSPQRRTGQPDNRSSHAWLATYWADELAKQPDNPELAARFAPVATELADGAETIQQELLAVQGSHSGITGYYRPDPEQVEAAMRPSATLNKIIDALH
ncbi:NADP-dependent isocitrate dehydrogenase [Trueperella bialowiezensis]|uniref:Isocitrate dehydrogenase [NADP] n=1 Tax=Trueperella bialowiezensis TaxID=312285 RepID=A0A448PDE9_9ACTO|nr:NADP-dependent isocitrate dehydrogenase [Trueperella bialowiezensis]VEI12961.1 Isocitrate dehydrogenase [NADP] [Trueperella bialowiezensis]